MGLADQFGPERVFNTPLYVGTNLQTAEVKLTHLAQDGTRYRWVRNRPRRHGPHRRRRDAVRASAYMREQERLADELFLRFADYIVS